VTSERPNSPYHWSKDFVEHLRTVHFTLIIVSTGLLLLLISSKPYNAVTALVQIEEILELKRAWSPLWLAAHGTKQTERTTSGEAGPDVYMNSSEV
jgi:hypothetical protein